MRARASPSRLGLSGGLGLFTKVESMGSAGTLPKAEALQDLLGPPEPLAPAAGAAAEGSLERDPGVGPVAELSAKPRPEGACESRRREKEDGRGNRFEADGRGFREVRISALQLGGEPEDPAAAAFARSSGVQVGLLWSFYHGRRHCASTNPGVCCFGLAEGPVCPGLPPEPVLFHHGQNRCLWELEGCPCLLACEWAYGSRRVGESAP